MNTSISKTVCRPFLSDSASETDYPIYMDYSATTPVDPRVVEKMLPYLYKHFGNAASTSHPYGWVAKNAVEEARNHIATLLHATDREIIFTSGATESNNLALKGAAYAYQYRGKHIISVKTEHKAVLDTLKELEEQGFEVTILDPNENGLITTEQLEEAIKPGTILISIMWVNNEIGVIQPIADIAQLCRRKRILFHCDAAQAVGKLEINLEKIPIDLLTITAHKVYGPKGIGALFVRRRTRLMTQMHGGGHENGLRSGTLPTHQIVGMGEAFRIAKEEKQKEIRRIRTLSKRLIKGLSKIEAIIFNGDAKQRIPHNINVSIPYIEGEALIMSLNGLAVSSGSACTSALVEPSHVLRALGRNPQLAHSSLRFTIGRFTTKEDVDFAIDLVTKQVARLRKISPIWDMYQKGVDLSAIEWNRS